MEIYPQDGLPRPSASTRTALEGRPAGKFVCTGRLNGFDRKCAILPFARIALETTELRYRIEMRYKAGPSS